MLLRVAQILARVLRNFSYGYLVVVVGIYLDQLGLTPIEVGAVLTASAAGSAALTIGWSLLADRIGRRRSIRVLSLLMVAGGLTFVITSDPWLLALAAFAGSLSVAGTDTGTFVTVDQSMLPQVSADHRRTSTFALQNMFATLAVAVGSLAAGAVPLLARIGLQGPDAYRPLFVLFAIVGLASFSLFLRLSPAVELVPTTVRPSGSRLGLGGSSGLIGLLVALNVIDSLAGGLMVQSIVAYWFYLVWRLDASTLALLFFWMNVLSALSMLAAGAIARRIGLFNTTYPRGCSACSCRSRPRRGSRWRSGSFGTPSDSRTSRYVSRMSWGSSRPRSAARRLDIRRSPATWLAW